MEVKEWLPFSKQIFKVVRAAVTDWIGHRAASKGAALAFYTLFSIAPVLMLVIAIAGFFWGADAARGQLLS
jgi:membrane protein